MRRVCRLTCGCFALASLMWFLLDRQEHAALAVPIVDCQRADDAADVWHWTLPDSVHRLASGRTPRRESSFLFINQRLVPLWFPYDTTSEAEREVTGWHQVREGRLEFRLPKGVTDVEPYVGERALVPAGAQLRLELNGAMSIRRQLALAGLALSLFGLAICVDGKPAFRFGVWPVVTLAALAPAAIFISFYVCAAERLPISWQSSTLGVGIDRLDAIAPGLLLCYALCGRYRDRRRAGLPEETQTGDEAASSRCQGDLSLFVRYGWLSGVTLILFSFTRLLSWGVGTTHSWSPVGISSPFQSAIDYSDAAGYLSGGYHLLAEGTLDQWNQRRPINVALFASRIALSGWSVDLAKWIQAVAVALAAGWAARELALCYGWRAGTAALALFWGCGRLFLATTLSEPLGFMLGTLAVVGLLRQMRTGKLAGGLCGTGWMALAQAARPGALFVLPALIMTVGSWGRGGRQRAISLALAALVVGGAMAVNPLLSRLYGTGDNLTGSNFAYTFAGLASGQSWSDVMEEYQEQLDELPNEKAVATFLYQEGFRLIRHQPAVFLGELARGIAQFANELPRFLIGITFRSNIDASSPLLWLQVLLMLAVAALAGIRQWRCRCQRDWALWLAIFIGCMASIPFVFLDGGLRVLMATWPAVLAWLAAGLAEPKVTAASSMRYGFDRTTGLLSIFLVGGIGMALLAPWLSYRLVGGVSAENASASEATSAGDFTFANAMEAADRQMEVSMDVEVLRVDRRMRGPGIQVRSLATRRAMTPEQWQRELQISGIGYEACLLPLMPRPPFRFDQVYDFNSGTLKILFLPGDTAEIESGTMAVETCSGSPSFGRRLQDNEE